MKRIISILLLLFLLFESCGQKTKQKKIFNNGTIAIDNDSLINVSESQKTINTSGTTLETRILSPDNFQRTKENKNSFSEYLRQLPLKPHGAEVMLYNGKTKPNNNIYVAVVDMEIGYKDLHQCADAIMRLRAEYLWNQKRYKDIHFNFTNGFRVDYSKWMEGKRIVVKGNKSYWIKKSNASNTYQDFWNYMELIFTYAGTLSLSKELESVDIADLRAGDVFIWGGAPGHAVLVVDIAKNLDTNEKIFLLAQSYMPAQEIQILQNPNNPELSPWYFATDIKEEIITPEWTFNIRDLKRFKD